MWLFISINGIFALQIGHKTFELVKLEATGVFEQLPKSPEIKAELALKLQPAATNGQYLTTQVYYIIFHRKFCIILSAWAQFVTFTEK